MKKMSGWKWVGLVLLLAVVCVAAVVEFHVFERQRDLAETLQWMDQTYNPHEGAENFGQGHGWIINYVMDEAKQIERENERFQMTFSRGQGCKIVVRYETFPVGVHEDAPGTLTFTFDLRDIDPGSIKIKTFDCSDPKQVQTYRPSCAEIEFQTRNNFAAITQNDLITFAELQGADHELRKTSKTSKSWFAVDDVEYAKRFAKALKHAAELCGGKPSKF